MVARRAGGEEAFPAQLTLSEAYSLLGVRENAPYEEVLSAKNKLLRKAEGNNEKQMTIEVAYDIIFSSQLKARLSGDLPVSNKVTDHTP